MQVQSQDVNKTQNNTFSFQILQFVYFKLILAGKLSMTVMSIE